MPIEAWAGFPPGPPKPGHFPLATSGAPPGPHPAGHQCSLFQLNVRTALAFFSAWARARAFFHPLV
jgi:hypothetical protein